MPCSLGATCFSVVHSDDQSLADAHIKTLDTFHVNVLLLIQEVRTLTLWQYLHNLLFV